MRRILLGMVSLGGLTVVISNAADGVFHWRGGSTSSTDGAIGFWLLIVVNGALFAGLLFWAISGRGFDKKRG